ncbi:PfkB family carbohydrate kinase [Frigidibacter sp. RF13]|uniref:PfkB family carbohydrate kinase n=1 Tax=Frigidibacter sp. RF13 TaxID=2997340 RepID=UPI00226E920B|nr:PfkB family carbohydrate kinase [Frigidibacter sp. RF13]MCY1125906.1 PfkB family carbohydrate kinase [Frigidibacter sp. RF13]
MSLLVCGALHHDVIVQAPRLPVADETLMGSAVSYAFGGKGGNQAVMAARMGARVEMAGAVGTDAAGDLLLAELAAAGVGASRVWRIDGASGMSVAILQADGEYGAVVVSGVNAAVDAARIDLPEDCRFLLLQNELPEQVNLLLARAAHARGIEVILNAAPARPAAGELLSLLSLLVVNRGEAAALVGDRLPAESVTALAALGPARAILTRGADGIAIWDGTAASLAAAVPVKAVSAHGAGDAFIGALAAGLMRGESLEEAAHFAQAAAALFVSTPPEGRSAIRRPQAERFLAGRAKVGLSAPERRAGEARR